MKKIIVLVVLICALGFFASQPSVDVPRQAAVETPSLLANFGCKRHLLSNDLPGKIDRRDAPWTVRFWCVGSSCRPI